MTQPPVRWAILGAGRIAHKFVADIGQVANAQLVAVASRNPERARVFAGQYAIPLAMDYETLYQCPEVDAVYIATTHNFHFEQALACMAAGKAVLCEKPITINYQQCQQLVAAAARHRVFLMEALWTFLLPAMQQAKTWMAAGRIGAVQSIHADFCYLMDYDPEGRLFNPQLAGGALLDLGIYPVAFAQYFMECQPDALTATALMTDTGVDASTSIIAQYGPVPAFLYTSLAGRSQNKGVIAGANGYIIVPDFFKATQAILMDANGKELDRFTDNRTSWGYHFEIAEATRCIQQGLTESPLVPHATSLRLHGLLTRVRHLIGLQYPAEQGPDM